MQNDGPKDDTLLETVGFLSDYLITVLHIRGFEVIHVYLRASKWIKPMPFIKIAVAKV